MYRADPATCEAAHAVAVLILNVPGRVHRPWLRFPRPGPQGPPNWSPTPRHVGPSSLHPSLAPPQVLVSNSSSLEIPPVEQTRGVLFSWQECVCSTRSAGPIGPAASAAAPQLVAAQPRCVSELLVWSPRNSATRYGYFEPFAYTPSRKRAGTGPSAFPFRRLPPWCPYRRRLSARPPRACRSRPQRHRGVRP